MSLPNRWQLSIERACNTEPSNNEDRNLACDEVALAVSERQLALLDLTVALAGPLTSPEKEAREHGTRLLGEVVSRGRAVLGDGELHTLAEFLAARLRDWPCVGAAAAACRALLQRPDAPAAGAAAAASGTAAGPTGGAGVLRDDSATLVLEATTEMLRSAQSFRQEERCALLQLLLAAARGWGGMAAARGSKVELLDAFLGAADGEKDPRCLLLTFEAVKALCVMYHAPGADPSPLRQLADEVADWASTYFPISFNPPPSAARVAGAITRADLAAALETALAASPFLAGGVLPLLLEKLSSTYRPAKQDALAALRRCCPAYGPDALAPHAAQLWPALRSEVLAPGGVHGGAAATATGDDGDGRLPLAAAAASCLTVVVRAAGPGTVDAMALQDSSVGNLLSIVRRAGSTTASASASAATRADGQVLCGAMLLAAVCAAGPASLHRAQSAALAQLQTSLLDSLTAAAAAAAVAVPDGTAAHDKYDQTLYGMAVLTAVIDAVAAELGPSGSGGGGGGAAAWLSPSGSDGAAALAEVKGTLAAALTALHPLLHPGLTAGLEVAAARADRDVAMDAAPGDASGDSGAARVVGTMQTVCYSPTSAAQLRLAAVACWKALLRLDAAASAAALLASAPSAAEAVQRLTLTAGEVVAAGEQLCACALEAGDMEAGGSSGPVAFRMQWGKQLDVPQEAAGALKQLLQLRPTSADTTTAEADASVVRLLVGRLAAAMGAAGGEGAAGTRAAALRLAVQLAEASPSPGLGSSGGRGDGVGAFAAALLVALPPLVLRLPGSSGDEEWLRDCLSQLAGRVLPAVAQRPAADLHRVAAAAAAADLVKATLAAAEGWEAAGGSGLPFGGAGAVAASQSPPPSPSSTVAALVGSWCAAVQQLAACCDDKQQLALALEAAECIASASATASATAALGRGWARLPLACAVVAGLRPPLLAPQSTQALADSLMRLLVSDASGTPPEHAASAATVALAAAVNRWQDPAALDAWLASSFRPELLQRIIVGTAPIGSSTAGAASAVGWVGRALALRNHPALREVVEALLGVLALSAAEAGTAATDMDVDGGCGAGSEATASGTAAAAEAAAAAAEAFGVLVADEASSGGVSLAARPSTAVCRVLWQQRTFSLCAQVLSEAAAGARPTQAELLPLPLALASACLVAAAPRTLCRNEAPRLAPLLLKSAQRLCRELSSSAPATGSAPAPSAAAPAPTPAAAATSSSAFSVEAAAPLRGALAVVLDWLGQQQAQPPAQLGKALEDHAAELVDTLCAAAAAMPPPGCPAAAAAAAVAVREEALRCCLALIDALPYHLLHPMRHKVGACVVRALDDNRRSVRQLAVRARRAWSDK